MDPGFLKAKMPSFLLSNRKKISYTKDELVNISNLPLSQQLPKCFLLNTLTCIPLRRVKKQNEFNHKPGIFSRRINDNFGSRKVNDTSNSDMHINSNDIGSYEKDQNFYKKYTPDNHEKLAKPKDSFYDQENSYAFKPRRNNGKGTFNHNKYNKEIEEKRCGYSDFQGSRTYKMSEPEWFSEGPFTHLDKMELKGFEDAPHSENYNIGSRESATQENSEYEKIGKNTINKKSEDLDFLIEKDIAKQYDGLSENFLSQTQPEYDDYGTHSIQPPNILIKLNERKESRFHALFENNDRKVEAPFISHSQANIPNDLKILMCGDNSSSIAIGNKSLTPFEKLVLAVKKQEVNPKITMDLVSHPNDAFTEEDILRDMQTVNLNNHSDGDSYGLFKSNVTHHLPTLIKNGNNYTRTTSANIIRDLTSNESAFNMLSMITPSHDTPWSDGTGIHMDESACGTKNVVNHFYSNITTNNAKYHHHIDPNNGAMIYNEGNRKIISNEPYPLSNLPNTSLPYPLLSPWYNQNLSQDSQQQYRLKMMAMAAAATAMSNPHPIMNPLSMLLAPPAQYQATPFNTSYLNNPDSHVPKSNQTKESNYGTNRNDTFQPLNLIQKASTLTPTAVFRQLVSSTLLTSNTEGKLKFKNSYNKSLPSQGGENVTTSVRCADNRSLASLPYETSSQSENISNDIQERQMMLMDILKNNSNLQNIPQFQSQNFHVQPSISSQHMLMLQHQYTLLLNLLNSPNNLSPLQKTVLQSYFSQLHTAIMSAGLQQYFMANPYLIPSISANYFQNLINSTNQEPGNSNPLNQNQYQSHHDVEDDEKNR